MFRVNSKYGRLVQEIRPHQHVKTSCLWCQFHQRIFHKTCQRGPRSKRVKNLCQRSKGPCYRRRVVESGLPYLVHFVLVFARSLSMLFGFSPTTVSTRNCKCVIFWYNMYNASQQNASEIIFTYYKWLTSRHSNIKSIFINHNNLTCNTN